MVDMSHLTTTGDNYQNYQTPSAHIDEPNPENETYWDNNYWAEGLGLWEDNPAYKEPTRAMARWTVGQGYTVLSDKDRYTLENIKGGGEDSFQSLMTNHTTVKRTNGDAYMEIVRNEAGRLVNLKPINPLNIRTVWNEKGIIIGYDELNNKKEFKRRFKPYEIFHSMHDRIANQTHGTPSWKACKWELETRKEVLANTRRILQLSTMRIVYIDMDDTTKLNQVKAEWKTAQKYGYVIFLPGKKGQDMEVVDYQVPDISALMTFINYLDSRIYQALGINKIIADVTDTSEASSKTGLLSWEPAYIEEQTLLEQDIWNQLAIKVKFNRPPSINPNMVEDAQKNTGQLRIQPNESQLKFTRSE